MKTTIRSRIRIPMAALAIGLAWCLSASAQASPQVTVQLLPTRSEGKHEPVSYLFVVVTNNTERVLHNVPVRLDTPRLERVAARGQARVTLQSGDAGGSSFLAARVKALQPGESVELTVHFESPAEFKSIDQWRAKYQIPSDIGVIRLVMGKAERVKSGER